LRAARRYSPAISFLSRAAQDHGFMYGRSIEDPDGYVWEIMWMDPAAQAGAPQSA
jgi:predicted lactoylglutathione lyase